MAGSSTSKKRPERTNEKDIEEEKERGKEAKEVEIDGTVVSQVFESLFGDGEDCELLLYVWGDGNRSGMPPSLQP